MQGIQAQYHTVSFPTLGMCSSRSQLPVFRFLCPWRHPAAFSTLCLRSILSTWTVWRTMIPNWPKFLVYALLLPPSNSPGWGSPLGISISLCDPGPCAATAICKVGSSCHVVNAKPCSRNKKDYDETTTPCYHV